MFLRLSGESAAPPAFFGAGQESGLLLGAVFRSVLLRELEERSSRLLVQALAELVDHWRHLESLLEDGLLSLEADVLGPSDESRQVTFRLDVLANSEVLWSLFEERVLLLDFLLLLDQGGSGGDASSLGVLY